MGFPTTDSYHNAIITCLSSGLDPQALIQPVVHLYKSSTHLSCYFTQRTLPPAPLPPPSLPIFPEELVPLQVSSCDLPHHVSVLPCISVGKEVLVMFCQVDPIALILSL